ncbi:MAG: division/cell wall cluster transcriptional repressor MraZ [Ignavibacteria bacterium]
MPGLKGSYTYSVDSKGRVNIPAKMRKAVSPEANDTFTITRGFEKCLFVYPQDEWAKLEQAIRALSPTNPQHRFFMRVLLQQAVESQLDAQARITIPKELLDFASIDGEVLILGVLDRIELWNPREYQAYLASQERSYEEVAQTVLQKKDM